MKTFRYSFQTVLERFGAIERTVAGTVAASEVALARECAALEALEEAATLASRRLPVATPARAGVFATLEAYLASLAAARVDLKERIAVAGHKLAGARAELDLAARRRSALERHRAHRFAEHCRLSELREAAELDECNELRRPPPGAGAYGSISGR